MASLSMCNILLSYFVVIWLCRGMHCVCVCVSDIVSKWPTCPVVMCCNVPEQWESFIPLQGQQGHEEWERQTQTEGENEDKLVGGRWEKIGDLERKRGPVKRNSYTHTHTDVSVDSEGLVWSHLSAEGWLCATRLMSPPLRNLWMLRRHDSPSHIRTLSPTVTSYSAQQYAFFSASGHSLFPLLDLWRYLFT